MGSIPLPALDVKPAEQPNLLGQYGQLMAIRGQQQQQAQEQAMAPLRQQMAQQQVQSGSLELQQRQQDQKDQQAISNWFMHIDPKDPNAFNPTEVGKTLAAQGVSGKGIMAAQSQLLQHQQTAAALTKEQLANQQQMNDSLYSGINGVIGITDPQQRAQAINALLPQAVQAKALQPEQAQQIAQNPAAVTDDQLKALQHGLGISSAFLGSVARMQTAQTGAQTAAIKAPGEQAISDSLVLKNAAQHLASSPDNASYQAALGELPMKIAKNFPATFDKNAVLQVGMAPNEVVEEGQRQQGLQQGKQRLGIEYAHLKLDQQKANFDQTASSATGDDFLATLPPGIQSQVKAMANGDIAVPPAGSRSPQAQQLRTAVMQYDPTYTDARYKGKQDFKNKGDAQNIVQLTTAMEHADRALRNSAKAGLSPMLGNKTFEDENSAAYSQDAEFLTGEVGKLVKNGVLSVDEGKKISSGLTSARQSVRDAALNETMDLLGGKARGVFQKYKTGTGQDLPINEFFDQKAQNNLVKYGIVPNSQQQLPSANHQQNSSPQGMVKVQIPGHPPGQIPAAALEKFKRENPNAQVMQ